VLPVSYKLLSEGLYNRRSSFGRLKIKEQDTVGSEDNKFMKGRSQEEEEKKVIGKSGKNS
jgi:hypothetical protein